MKLKFLLPALIQLFGITVRADEDPIVIHEEVLGESLSKNEGAHSISSEWTEAVSTGDDETQTETEEERLKVLRFALWINLRESMLRRVVLFLDGKVGDLPGFVAYTDPSIVSELLELMEENALFRLIFNLACNLLRERIEGFSTRLTRKTFGRAISREVTKLLEAARRLRNSESLSKMNSTEILTKTLTEATGKRKSD